MFEVLEMSKGVAAQLRKKAFPKTNLPHRSKYPDDYLINVSDVLAVLATQQQQLQELDQKYEKWHYLSYRTLLTEILQDMKRLLSDCEENP